MPFLAPNFDTRLPYLSDALGSIFQVIGAGGTVDWAATRAQRDALYAAQPALKPVPDPSAGLV